MLSLNQEFAWEQEESAQSGEGKVTKQRVWRERYSSLREDKQYQEGEKEWTLWEEV